MLVSCPRLYHQNLNYLKSTVNSWHSFASWELRSQEIEIVREGFWTGIHVFPGNYFASEIVMGSGNSAVAFGSILVMDL